MKLTFTLASLLFASTVFAKTDLYSKYQEYQHEIRQKHYQRVIDTLLSQKNKQIATQEGGANHFENTFPVLTSVATMLSNEKSHYQSIMPQRGCLTINGLDSDNEPTSFNIEYVEENGGWKLNYIQVSYLSSPSDFQKKAVCPKKAPVSQQ